MNPTYMLVVTPGTEVEEHTPRISATLVEGAVTVDERSVDAELVSIGPRYLRLLVNGRLRHLPYVRQAGRILFWVQGAALEFVPADQADSQPHAQPRGFATEVRAPMPGKILSLEVEPGQELGAGDALVLMEAMKMETTLRAVTDCRVAEIRATAGQMVSQDDVLVVLEETIGIESATTDQTS